LTRTDRGYWQARARQIDSDTPPRLWGALPVELYEGHHPDPAWDVRRRRDDGLGYVAVDPNVTGRLVSARSLTRNNFLLARPTTQGVTSTQGNQPSALDVEQDTPREGGFGIGFDWRLLGLGALAVWFFMRRK